MQLVGAKTSFIVMPFLRRSLWHGLLSGLLASALIYALLQYGNSQIENLNLLATMEQIALVFLSLLLLGSIIAFFSTYRAVNKYLKMSLDELY
jgi:cell division transport system permease protein